MLCYGISYCTIAYIYIYIYICIYIYIYHTSILDIDAHVRIGILHMNAYSDAAHACTSLDRV